MSEIPRPPFRTLCQHCGTLTPAHGVCQCCAPSDGRARLEADLAALREAAQAVDETSNHIVLTGRSAESVAAAQLALQNLRAVLASADSEGGEETP